MKTIILKVQIKIDEDNLSSSQKAEDVLDDILALMETPVQDENLNPINHLQKFGYEVMIMDRSDK